MKEMGSLNQFFTEINCRFQCYNMGRRIYPVDHQSFIDFESTHSTWKAPFLQHAWIAVLFWKDNPIPSEHHVWFLKLPLDELAKLNQAARDDFLRHLFEALGNNSTQAQTQKKASDKLHSLENAMKDNPYGFQPKTEQMANFHAIVHKQLSLPASSYYQDTQDYLDSSNRFKEWNKLGFQGFADIAARLDESAPNNTHKSNEQLVNEAIHLLPIEPFQVLGSCLENHRISKQTTEAIYNRLLTELEKNNNADTLAQWSIASIRAASHASSQESIQILQVQLISKILSTEMRTNIEVLATISGRCWELIPQTEILVNFLESLAIVDNQHQGAFKAILSDLMFIPGMRGTILQAFRSPERSQQLTQAIGSFFSAI